MLKVIRYFVIIIIIIFIISLFFYWQGVNSTVKDIGEDKIFLVSSGESVDQIGENLHNADLIKSKFYFKAYIWRAKKQTDLQAGEYILNPSLSIKEIVNALASGQSLSKERTIKIIEGWDLRDISFYFENQGMFQSEGLLELVGMPKIDYRYNKGLPKPKDYSKEYSLLNDKPSYYSLEGYLFPDTYRIFKDASLEEIVNKMLDNIDKKLTSEMRTGINKQNKTIYEIITMASIIEKEVRTARDMEIVSGIFWDRMKYGIPLQADATLSYALDDKIAAHSLEDLNYDSPYNTYKYKDLPPGPICNPGLNAIKAAIYPKYTDYSYFLNRPDTGETIFSKTLEEHNRNKAKYLK